MRYRPSLQCHVTRSCNATPPPTITTVTVDLYLSDVCWTFVELSFEICRTSIQRSSTVRWTSVQHLLTIRRTSVRPPSEVRWTFVRRPTDIHRTSIQLSSCRPTPCHPTPSRPASFTKSSCALPFYVLHPNIMRPTVLPFCHPIFSSNICLTFVQPSFNLRWTFFWPPRDVCLTLVIPNDTPYSSNHRLC